MDNDEFSLCEMGKLVKILIPWALFLSATGSIPINLIKSENRNCRVRNTELWTLIKWFYGFTPNIDITHIVEDPMDALYSFNPDFFIVEILENSTYTITFEIVTLSHDEKSINFINTYSWTGEKFILRKEEQDRISYRNRRSIKITGDLDNFDNDDDDDDQSLNTNLRNENLPARDGEPELGAFVIIEKVSDLNTYLTGIARKPFLWPRRTYVIAILDANERDFRPTADRVLKKLWRDYGIVNVILIMPCNENADVIGTYDPYKIFLKNDTFKWGEPLWLTIDEFKIRGLEIFRKLENLNGYPLRVSIFERYPTALQYENIPKIFLRSYFMNTVEESKGFGGLDGIVLGNMAKGLNFTVIPVFPRIHDFGYKLKNGTFVGEYCIKYLCTVNF